jgi:hypothetical protein
MFAVGRLKPSMRSGVPDRADASADKADFPDEIGHVT